MIDSDDFILCLIAVLCLVLLLLPAGMKLYDFAYEKGHKQGQIDYMNGQIYYEKVQKEEYREIKIK